VTWLASWCRCYSSVRHKELHQDVWHGRKSWQHLCYFEKDLLLPALYIVQKKKLLWLSCYNQKRFRLQLDCIITNIQNVLNDTDARTKHTLIISKDQAVYNHASHSASRSRRDQQTWEFINIDSEYRCGLTTPFVSPHWLQWRNLKEKFLVPYQLLSSLTVNIDKLLSIIFCEQQFVITSVKRSFFKAF